MNDENPTPHDVACYCTQSRRLARTLTDIYDAALAPTGLKVTQFSLLRAVERTERPTLSAVAEATALDRSTLGRNLRVLEKDGFVRLAPGKDSRTRVVTLTDKARSALDGAAPIWADVQTRVAAALPAESLAALRTLSRAARAL